MKTHSAAGCSENWWENVKTTNWKWGPHDVALMIRQSVQFGVTWTIMVPDEDPDRCHSCSSHDQNQDNYLSLNAPQSYSLHVTLRGGPTHRVSFISTMFPANMKPSSLSFSHLIIRLCQSAALSLIFRALPVTAVHFLFAEVTVMSLDRPEEGWWYYCVHECVLGSWYRRLFRQQWTGLKP